MPRGFVRWFVRSWTGVAPAASVVREADTRSAKNGRYLDGRN
jgi:hypothetical protein